MTDDQWAGLSKQEREVALQWARMSTAERELLLRQVDALLAVTELMSVPAPVTRRPPRQRVARGTHRLRAAPPTARRHGPRFFAR